MNILVTGAAGFIGSHLAERLLAEGFAVTGVDCFTNYYPRRFKEDNLRVLRLKGDFHFIEGDLLSLELTSLLKGIDVVYHLAAQAGVRASWGREFDVYVDNNIRATQRLLEAARVTGLKKFIFASSSSVYGDAETFPTSEASPTRPFSPYGVTKLAAEHLCSLYWENYGVPTVSLRYFTVYGPGQRPDMAFYKFFKAILTGQPLPLFGDGFQSRDFTYIDDIVEGSFLAAGAPPGAIYNLGGGHRVTVKEVICLMEELAGVPARVQSQGKQKGDVKDTSADITRAQRELGYRPRTTLADGLAAQLKWMRERVLK
ncbi:MAG: NAD-dependent epimerase/dehydratase family protein [Eubacteriales bacterium]